MGTRVTGKPATERYVQRYASPDGRIHDFALEELAATGDNPMYVPRCQENRKFPTAKFFPRELHDADEVGQEHRCPYCVSRARSR